MQGVGFRPHVARVARACGLAGWVQNDAGGVRIALACDERGAATFERRLTESLPPLARVDAIAIEAAALAIDGRDFRILASETGPPRTDVAPDAAPCAECLAEIEAPSGRRRGYAFTSCASCGPRYSIVVAIPYDRASTTMAGFPLCDDCRAEHDDPCDRRFHAQPIACPACGPSVWVEPAHAAHEGGLGDAIDAAAELLRRGRIVAVKGVGGFHLVCDAGSRDAVRALRERKHRHDKPFALLARDLEVVARYAEVDPIARRALASHAAPIVILERAAGAASLAPEVAPGLTWLGMMLPSTPLHARLARSFDRPLVCTSGNVSDEPPSIDDDDARARLGAIADAFLMHDRPIARRLDDSIVRPMAGAARVLRRARGYAPESIAMPPGFERAPSVLALGADLKSSVCLLHRGRVIPSEHLGDLDDARALRGFWRGVGALSALFEHEPRAVAIDRHPSYRASLEGRALAARSGVPLVEVGHHHAHVASCLLEHGHPRSGEPVLGFALDGLGYGERGELWGAELLVATYDSYERVGTLKPAALLGGDRAAREPWRNLYARLAPSLGWGSVAQRFGRLEAIARLDEKPRATLDAMMTKPGLAPLASSAGRLFDAVAAALSVRFEEAHREGQAAMEVEALVDARALAEAASRAPYPFAIDVAPGSSVLTLDPAPMWPALLGDLLAGAPRELVAARFHLALAEALAALAARVKARMPTLARAALSGGVFQNKVLLEATIGALERAGFTVWAHASVPPNDGGIAVGQAAIAAARLLSAGAREE